MRGSCILLLFVLVGNLFSCHSPANSDISENNKSDSLGRYSYLLWGSFKNNNQQKVVGTCFFVRRGYKLLLVTAAHLFNGTEYNGKSAYKNSFYPEILYLRLFDSSGLVDSIPINIKNILDTIVPFSPHEKPDVIAQTINIPSEFKVNSIEKFLKPDSPNYNLASEISMFGFFNVVSDKGEYARHHFPPQKRNLIIIRDYYKPDLSGDTINLCLNTSNVDVGPGDSGSPIFFKIQNEIVFGGICQGGNPAQSNELCIVKTKFVTKEINRK